MSMNLSDNEKEAAGTWFAVFCTVASKTDQADLLRAISDDLKAREMAALGLRR